MHCSAIAKAVADRVRGWSNSSMEFHCEDFPQHGVVLVPPSSPEYDLLVEDIQRRIDHRVQGSPPLPESMSYRISEQDRETSAIILNRSPNGIAAIQSVWSLQETNGRTYTASRGGGSNPSVLLPFGISGEGLRCCRYWNAILPGSKRYLNADGEQVGDNSDVRPPAPDEIWMGGVGGASGGRRRFRGPMKTVTLTLDGVFFDDGGFVGPNQKGLWEQIVFSAEAHLRLAKLAREGHDNGVAPRKILAGIENITGPATDFPPAPLPLRGAWTPETCVEAALQRLAWQIGMTRKHQGDERTVHMLMAWGETRLPHFRKL
jgi:hypothetical protein